MKILVIAATPPELGPLTEQYSSHPNLTILFSGAGMVATAYALGRELALNTYHLVINAGIAGSFDRSIPLGQVLNVTEDHFAELGAEDDEEFLPFESLGIGGSSGVIFQPPAECPRILNELKKAKGITVNTVHGNEFSIYKTAQRLQPVTESMEGAAAGFACLQAGVACIQVRAISNYVEKRNREAWNIPLAIKNLNTFVAQLIEEIT
jgi:futalosine hydrolase